MIFIYYEHVQSVLTTKEYNSFKNNLNTGILIGKTPVLRYTGITFSTYKPVGVPTVYVHQ